MKFFFYLEHCPITTGIVSFGFIHLFMLISAFVPNDSSKIDNISPTRIKASYNESIITRIYNLNLKEGTQVEIILF